MSAAEFIYEIKRSSEETWHEMDSQTAAELERQMNVAGTFEVRILGSFSGGPDSTDVVVSSAEDDFEAQFPSYDDIVNDGDAVLAFNDTWQTTLNSTTDGSRREYGFWIRYNAVDQQFEFTEQIAGPEVDNDTGATINLGSRPADDPVTPSPLDSPVYTVGSFHTHTPTTYRSVGRSVGPSSPDHAADTADDVAGVVYDFEATVNSLWNPSPPPITDIPPGHPTTSSARLFHSGPDRRTTPE